MSGPSEDLCVVCFKTVKIYSIGCCDHNVCFECSTRMRVLCRQNECPICRSQIETVVFISEIKPFAAIKDAYKLFDKKYNIWFASQKIHDAFYKLLEHNCSICRNKSFNNFQSLSDHMKRSHDLFYCDLCVTNLKILTSERRSYTRSELSQHRRKGDPDDRSHRGHPLCEFCDTRYMDNDDLYRHVRRDHLYCHFCDADGLHMYYSSYDYLRDHFRQEHFLCEEGGCAEEKFTPVFRTEIDLRAHRASEHGRALGKVAAKQARTLELEFTLKPRSRPHDARRKGRGQDQQGFVEQLDEEIPVEVRRDPTPPLTASNFPTLGDGSGSSSVPLTNIAPSRANAYTIRAGISTQGLQYDQHFPGLPGEAPAPATSTVRLNINAERKTGKSTGSQPNVSIKVTNHRPNRSIAAPQEAFPALKPSSNAASASLNWVQVSKSIDSAPPTSSRPSSSMWTAVSKKKTPAPAPVVKPQLVIKAGDEDFPSLNTKFSANLNLQAIESKTNAVSLNSNANKNKKASSVTIPVEKNWPEPENSQLGKGKTKKKKKTGSEDTVRKKESKPASLDKAVSSPEKVNSALSERGKSDWKPLPTAADWFDSTLVNSLDEPGPDEAEINQVLESVINYSRLMSNKTRKPPPGFAPLNGVKPPPPPGFSTPRPASNGLTFTNSYGEIYAIPESAQYIIPSDFTQRNQQLVTKVNEMLLSEDAVEDFRWQSSAFRSGEITADEYYWRCLKVMGDDGVSEMLPELLALLPDITKQQELLAVLRKHGRAALRGKRKLEVCSVCRQVVFASEMKSHLSSHLLNNNSLLS